LVDRELVKKYPFNIHFLDLSRNFGEHNAVMAGLNHCTGDYAVIMDDDFQNPPTEIDKLINHAINEKLEVVYGVYLKKRHNIFRNIGSKINDLVANIMLKKGKDLYLSSFKCMSRFVINEVIKYKGPFPYIDGLILRVTKNVGRIEVEHRKREVGKSNYTLSKLISLWMNMFVNFSIIPLRVATFLGALLTITGFLIILYFLISMYIIDPEGVWPPGWASLLVSLIVFSGAQLLTLGVLGEYVGKLLLADNQTPQYVVRNKYDGEKY
jgi:undecaprenyl-phosphate 4-deoxy-4-formamido-L-arabinose transferase